MLLAVVVLDVHEQVVEMLQGALENRNRDVTGGLHGGVDADRLEAAQHLTTLSPAALLQARHKIGMIFQHFNLLFSRTVYANIALPLELIGADKRTIAAKVQELCRKKQCKGSPHTYVIYQKGCV